MNPHSYQRLIDAVRHQYPDFDLLEHNGVPYPVTLARLAADQHDDVDRILAPHSPETFADPATFALYDHAHLDGLKRTRSRLTNGISYIFDRLEVNGDEPRLYGQLGHYFDMLATCDALDVELQAAALNGASNVPNRDRLHAAIPPGRILHTGRGRSAIIGVATLLVYRRDGEYRTLLARRSGGVATGANQFHVLPAFVFQPNGPQHFYAREWRVSHQMLREFGEELFGMPEFPEWPGADSPEYFYDFPPVADLRAMLADGRASLHLTGLMFSLPSTRPELCTLLMIHDEAWHARWAGALAAAVDFERQTTVELPIAAVAVEAALPQDIHLHITPQGAAALWLGLDRARSIIQARG